jgi:hypothetical protein
MRRILPFVTLWIAGLCACESMKEYALENDREHEGKMTGRALKDFWSFTTDHGPKPEEGGDLAKPRKDVFAMKDLSTKRRGRLLVDVDAYLTLAEDTLRDRGFRLARHLMVDTGGQAVRLRFWVRGCRRLCGVFAELTLTGDGLTFDGGSRGEDKSFGYVPTARPWTKLTPVELKSLVRLETHLVEAEGRGDKRPMDSALRATAGETGQPPAELSALARRVSGWFVQPR